jgi:hypothetical protein
MIAYPYTWNPISRRGMRPIANLVARPTFVLVVSPYAELA